MAWLSGWRKKSIKSEKIKNVLITDICQKSYPRYLGWTVDHDSHNIYRILDNFFKNIEMEIQM